MVRAAGAAYLASPDRRARDELLDRCLCGCHDHTALPLPPSPPSPPPAPPACPRPLPVRHDVSVALRGAIAADFARHFIQAWNHARADGIFQAPSGAAAKLPCLLPLSFEAAAAAAEGATHRGKRGDGGCLCTAQAVRSAGQWSVGAESAEASCHAAYVRAIRDSKRFVYIENQFFVSDPAAAAAEGEDDAASAAAGGAERGSEDSLNGGLGPTCRGSESGPGAAPSRNGVARAILERLRRALRSGDTAYRLIVVMPTVPEVGSGDVRGNGALRAVLHYQLGSIRTLRALLVAEFDARAVDSSLCFCSLMAAGTNGRGESVCHEIYVHAKLLIADDDTLVVGSANINDRSLLGARDSELGVVLRGPRGIAASLRRTLWRQHLGDKYALDPKTGAAVDPSADVWRALATVNAALFRECFPHLPSDVYGRAADMPEGPGWLRPKGGEGPAAAEGGEAAADEEQHRRQLLGGVRGHVVSFPSNWLKDEPLGDVLGGYAASWLPAELFS